jgi:uncharacterized SAM-binding protein YcdF (DUF218 family)
MNCLLAACAGAALGPRRFGRALRIVGLGGLVVFSLPVVAGSLTALLELGLNPPPPPVTPPQAIVILSGDETAIRVGPDIKYRPGPLTLEREQAGAALSRATHLPVLVSGGQIFDGTPTLAAIMVRSLDADFGIQVKWREDRSLDTWANAADSAAILHAAGINSVYLVTHAWHMHRALVAFRRAGLQAAAAPVAIENKPNFRPGAFVPAAHAWLESYWGMHELIGWAWYALKP